MEPIICLEIGQISFKKFIMKNNISKVLYKKSKQKKSTIHLYKTVKKKFLMTRYLEEYIDLFNSFETIHKIKMRRYLNDKKVKIGRI